MSINCLIIHWRREVLCLLTKILNILKQLICALIRPKNIFCFVVSVIHLVIVFFLIIIIYQFIGFCSIICIKLIAIRFLSVRVHPHVNNTKISPVQKPFLTFGEKASCFNFCRVLEGESFVIFRIIDLPIFNLICFSYISPAMSVLRLF